MPININHNTNIIGINSTDWISGNSSFNVGIGTTNPTSRLTVGGNVLVSGVITATSFVGDGSGLTGLPSGSQWVTTTAGIHTLSNVGIGTTNPTSELTVSGDVLVSGVITATSFVGNLAGTADIAGIATYATTAGISTVAQGLSGTPDLNVGVVTATAFVGDGSGLTNLPLPSRVAISSTTISMINLDTVSLEMQAYKTYIINSIFIDKPARVRLYTDNTSRVADVGRGVGTDPAPGSGLILEVVSTVSNYTQKVTPFVVGGNLDEPTTNTAYFSITNQSGTTTGIGITVSFLSLDF